MSISDLNISSESFLDIDFDKKVFESDSRIVFAGNDNITGKQVMVDLLKKNVGVDAEIQETVKNLTWLAHPNILEYKSSFLIESPGHLGLENDSCCIIVQQLFEGASTLEIYLRTLPSNELKKEILVQTLRGLDYLHSNDTVHANLHPQNILIRQNGGKIDVKLKGFGLPVSKATPIDYSPPEYFANKSGSISGDVWSFGAILFEMVMGYSPFGSQYQIGFEKVKNNILSGLIGKMDSDLSPKVKYLIIRCLQIDPTKRLGSVKEAYDILQGKTPIPQEFIEENFSSMISSSVILDKDIPLQEEVVSQEETKTNKENKDFDNNELVDSIFIEEDEEVIVDLLDEENDLIEKINSSVEPSRRKENWREKTADSEDTALHWTWSVLWIIIGLFAITFFSIYIITNNESGSELATPTQEIASQSDEVSTQDPVESVEEVVQEVVEETPAITEDRVRPNESIKMPEEEPADVRDMRRIQYTGANGNVGLKDGVGNIVAPPIYQYIGQFDGGLAMVKKENKWGFINMDGEESIKPDFDFVTNFTSGLAAVRSDGKWGYISSNGKAVGEISYDYVKSFSQNRAAVSQEGKWGYIDRNGRVVIPLKYEDAQPFVGGKAKVSFEGEVQVINLQGDCIEGCR